MKMNKTQRAFFMGNGFEHQVTHKLVFSALTEAIRESNMRAKFERERVVDPYNRAVEQ